MSIQPNTGPGYKSIYVNSSYYTLCDGSNGACAGVNGLSGCSNSAGDQAAWVNLNGDNLDSGCTCDGFSGTEIPSFSCDDHIIVTDLCTGNEETVIVTDHASLGSWCITRVKNRALLC